MVKILKKPESSPAPIQFERVAGNLAILTLNRPTRCNALSLELLRLFLERLDIIRNDLSVCGLVILGNGDHFCAGLDLREAVGGPPVLLPKQVASERYPEPFFSVERFPQEQQAQRGDIMVSRGMEMARLVSETLDRILHLPQPVVVAVGGAAIGGGTAFAAVSDWLIAAPNARFALPETGLGLTPSLLHPFLSRNLPSGLHSRMATGEPLSASEAQLAGWVRTVLDSPEQLFDSAMQTIEQIKPNGWASLTREKERRRAERLPTLHERLAGLATHAQSWDTPTVQTRIAEFLHRRKGASP